MAKGVPQYLIELGRRAPQHWDKVMVLVQHGQQAWERMSPDTRERVTGFVQRTRKARGIEGRIDEVVAEVTRLAADSREEDAPAVRVFLDRAKRLQSAIGVSQRLQGRVRRQRMRELNGRVDELLIDLATWFVDREVPRQDGTEDRGVAGGSQDG